MHSQFNPSEILISILNSFPLNRIRYVKKKKIRWSRYTLAKTRKSSPNYSKQSGKCIKTFYAEWIRCWADNSAITHNSIGHYTIDRVQGLCTP